MIETLSLYSSKRWLEKLYSEKTLELDYKSCEMTVMIVAQQTANNKYPKNVKLILQ